MNRITIQALLPVLLCVFFSLISQTLFAQWSFREEIHYSGKCEGIMGGIVNAFNAQIPDISGFPTRAECEAARAQINSIRYTLEGCTTYATATPCVGHDVGGVGGAASIANPTVGATAQGTSFFYTTAPEEVKNWQAEQDRINALIGNIDTTPETGLSKTADKGYNAAVSEDLSKYNYSSSSGVYIGNGVFTGIPATPLQTIEDRADMTTVMFYMGKLDDSFYEYLLMHPSEIYSLLPQKYQGLTGYDIDVIINKDPASRSPEEQAALDNYNAFVKEVCSEADKYAIKRIAEIDSKPEKKALDMAILAKLCYNDGDDSYGAFTNYRHIESLESIDNTNVAKLFEAVQKCNATEDDTGLRVELYFNDFTGEYSVAFRGTESWEDFENDSQMLLNFIPEQIMQLGDLIKAIEQCDAEVNITGHSLGGALASYVGLQTKRNTYTFNALGLNDAVLSTVYDYNDSKINAYRSTSELLVSVSQSVVPYVSSTVTDTGEKIIPIKKLNPEGTTAQDDNKYSGHYKLTIPGQEYPVEQGGKHRINPMIEKMAENNQAIQHEWFDVHTYRHSIASTAQDSALYRQDHILIVAQ